MPKIINLLSYDIAENIEKYIYINNLKSGNRLPTERQFAAEFGVTRVTVRQALQRLIDQGLITNLRNNGYFVNAPKMDRDLVTYCFPFSDKNIPIQNYSTKDIDYMPDYIRKSCFEYLDANGNSHLSFRKTIEYINATPISLTFSMQKSSSLVVYPWLFLSKIVPPNLIQNQMVRVHIPSEEEKELLEITENDSLLLITNYIKDATDTIAVSISICVGTRTNLISNITV
ncbi:MAG: GntR family transcriptional regulator [Lachnospiraceae bacterium]|nr:GntR family transcriptional regulator [Lachnospiraceae bacterium]